MTNHISRLVLVTTLILTTTAPAQRTSPDLRVDLVRLEGLEQVSEQLVRSQIEIHAGDLFSPHAVARDLRRLYELGFFSTIQVDLDTSVGQTIVTYRFREEQLIDQITIIGNDKLKTRDILSALSSREGDAFDPEAYAQERDAILELYASKSFLNATVDVTVEKVAPSRVHLIYAIQEGKKARIKNIHFKGNSALDDRALRGAIKTKRSFWKLRGKFDEDKFEADLRNILEEYANVGRLEADILYTDFSYSPNGKKLNITIAIDEGPEYRIGKLELTDNFVFDDQELNALLKTEMGAIHNKSQVTQDADAIQTKYRENGYINAHVSPQVILDHESETTHLVYRVRENNLKYIREIQITGNAVTRDDVARRQLLLSPGDRFDGTALRNSQNRLNSTGFFDAVRFTAEDVEENDRFSDLLIDVEEGGVGTFNFGGGFSSDTNANVFAEIRLHNFDITNWPTFSGGGQQLSTRFIIGDVRSQYSVSFTDPEIAGYPISFGVDFFDESFRTRGGSSFRQDSQGARLRLRKALSPFVAVYTALSFREVQLSALEPFFAPELNPLRDPGSTLSLIVGLTRNTTDLFGDPGEGARHDLSLEFAGLGADNDFLKLQHDSTWYFPIDKDKEWVFSFRTREAWAEPSNETKFVPIQDRLFAGGSTTLRGYDTRDVGPKALLTDGRREAIGGEFRVLATAEIKHRLNDILRVYTFTDAGGVWLNADDFDSNDLRYSIGIGMGFNIPALGPLRIDYGIPLNPDEDQGSGRLHLNTGFRF